MKMNWNKYEDILGRIILTGIAISIVGYIVVITYIILSAIFE